MVVKFTDATVIAMCNLIKLLLLKSHSQTATIMSIKWLVTLVRGSHAMPDIANIAIDILFNVTFLPEETLYVISEKLKYLFEIVQISLDIEIAIKSMLSQCVWNDCNADIALSILHKINCIIRTCHRSIISDVVINSIKIDDVDSLVSSIDKINIDTYVDIENNNILHLACKYRAYKILKHLSKFDLKQALVARNNKDNIPLSEGLDLFNFIIETFHDQQDPNCYLNNTQGFITDARREIQGMTLFHHACKLDKINNTTVHTDKMLSLCFIYPIDTNMPSCNPKYYLQSPSTILGKPIIEVTNEDDTNSHQNLTEIMDTLLTGTDERIHGNNSSFTTVFSYVPFSTNDIGMGKSISFMSDKDKLEYALSPNHIGKHLHSHASYVNNAIPNNKILDDDEDLILQQFDKKLEHIITTLHSSRFDSMINDYMRNKDFYRWISPALTIEFPTFIRSNPLITINNWQMADELKTSQSRLIGVIFVILDNTERTMNVVCGGIVHGTIISTIPVVIPSKRTMGSMSRYRSSLFYKEFNNSTSIESTYKRIAFKVANTKINKMKVNKIDEIDKDTTSCSQRLYDKIMEWGNSCTFEEVSE